MMNKLQLFIFLVCICMLAGCTEEEENSGIRLIEGTASGQTVFALSLIHISEPTRQLE